MYYQVTIDKLDELADYEIVEAMDSFHFNGIEEQNDELNIYFEEGTDLNAVKALLDANNRSYTVQAIPDRNWNAVWESNFNPVLVDDFCYIKAPFHNDVAFIEHTIHITPKMSFGTGHHATTFQMIKQMRDIDFVNKSVLDFGTGTGVLAILATMMHAKKVVAIDNDDWSVDNAMENATINQCTQIDIFNATISDLSQDEQFDIILANINRHVLLENMSYMKQLLTPNGKIILSGILEEDIPIIMTSIIKNNLKVLQTSKKNNWVCMTISCK